MVVTNCIECGINIYINRKIVKKNYICDDCKERIKNEENKNGNCN